MKSHLLPKGVRQSFDDYADVVQYVEAGEVYGTGKPDDTPNFGAPVGQMAAAVLAAAGVTLCNFAGRVKCETDYLVLSGATFPADVTREEMEAFNAATLKPDMDEADEWRRYASIAHFFKRA